MLRHHPKFFFTLATLLSLLTTSTLASVPSDVHSYIKTVSKQYGFNPKQLSNLLTDQHYDKDVIEKITHPYESKAWQDYQRFFLTQNRIDQGVIFFKSHQKILQQIKQRYGVDPWVIVAILGVETNYGKNIGSYSALNALYTLSFHYLPRQKFFKSELTNLLLLTRKNKLDITTIQSSYAGALGIPQFMPSAYLHYAVDFDNKKQINLFGDSNDAIASVANYLKQNKWQSNQPIAMSFKPSRPIQKGWLSTHAIPRYTAAQLNALGITPQASLPKKLRAAIIEVSNNKDTQHVYWLSFNNFKAIMRYNPRIPYAMVVYQLSESIKKKYQATHKQ